MARRQIHRMIEAVATIILVAMMISGRASHAAQVPAKARWVSFKSTLLDIQVSVPSDWKPIKIPKALAFHADDLAGGTAAVGILKSDQSGTIEQEADTQFESEGRPADWVRSNARIDGMRAIKIVGLVAKNPERKMVHYYIETPKGNYLVQCQATADRWSTYGPVFATILSKLKFLQ
jgi:hypothetical protein